MKIEKISNIQEFFKIIDSCKGRVELLTGEGDRLNLKSKLCQYLSMGQISHGRMNFIWKSWQAKKRIFRKYAVSSQKKRNSHKTHREPYRSAAPFLQHRWQRLGSKRCFFYLLLSGEMSIMVDTADRTGSNLTLRRKIERVGMIPW